MSARPFVDPAGVAARDAPFSARRRRPYPSAQALSTWTTPGLPAVAGVPTSRSPSQSSVALIRKVLRDDVVDKVARGPAEDAPLGHRLLEEGVLERSLKTQPDHASAGLSETLVRDVATSVVREIVGVLESLTDRLLLEKKHSVIRHMVAELMTEDIAESIATGRQQLRELEFGQINRDLELLQKRAEGFDVKLAKQEEGIIRLRESHEDLRLLVEENHSSIQETHKTFATSVDLKVGLRTASDHHKDLEEELRRLGGNQSDTECRLLEHRRHGQEHYATREELSKTELRLIESIVGCQDRTDQGLLEVRELRRVAPEKSHLIELRDAHHDRLRSLDDHASQSRDHVAQLKATIKELQDFCAETYMEKVDSAQADESLESKVQQLEATMTKSLNNLEAEKATKQELHQLRSTLKAVNTNLQHNLNVTKSNIEQGQRDAECFKGLCDAKFATRLYTDEVSSKAADDALKSSLSHVSGEVSRLGQRLGVDRNTRVPRHQQET
mmetsp:Transcript_76956/g.152390  ORF Transcript_76956/g.152390 Transcript_76956/m.152390 type:complete len:500 (-) Transcript_76956:100-1599(-)